MLAHLKITGKQKPEFSAEAEVHGKPNQRTFFGKHHMRNTFEVFGKILFRPNQQGHQKLTKSINWYIRRL